MTAIKKQRNNLVELAWFFIQPIGHWVSRSDDMGW